MKLSDVMEHAGLSMYAEVALLLFLFSFLVILWWVLNPANRKRFESDGALPLDDMRPRRARRPEVVGDA